MKLKIKERDFLKKLIKYFHALDPNLWDQTEGILKDGKVKEPGCVGCHVAKIFGIKPFGYYEFDCGRDLFFSNLRPAICEEIEKEAEVFDLFGRTAWASPPAEVFEKVLKKYS